MIKLPLWVKVSIAIIAIGISAAASYKVTAMYYEAEILKIEKTYTDEQVKIAREQADKLRAAKSLGDVLSANLANSEAEINQLNMEKTRAINQFTSGNHCFSAELTKLLNTDITSNRLPDTASPSNAESGAIAETAISEALTDQDIAYWVANAQSQYEICRQRLSNLIDFNNGVSQ